MNLVDFYNHSSPFENFNNQYLKILGNQKFFEYKMSLLLLPDELIGIIGSLIEVDDLLRLCGMSSKLAELCHDPQFWQNRILSYYPSMANLNNLSVKQLIDLYRKVRQSGHLYIFGVDMYGILGLGNVTFQAHPTKVMVPDDIFQISCGYRHSAVVTADGHIYMFGYNNNYQLGLGDTGNRNIPIPILGFSNVVQVSCGYEFTAFITDNGQLYTFGDNYYGEVGSDQGRDLTRPSLFNQLIDKKIVQVSCGYGHMGILTDQGEAYVWGKGDYGQLGQGRRHIKSTSVPVLVNINQRIKQLVCGYDFTAVLTEEGDVYMSGLGRYGRTGVEGIIYIYSPEKVRDLPSINQISLGHDHSLFLTTTGEVYGCGDNSSYQLGVVGNKIYHPVKIDYLPPIKQVAAGATHSVFLTTRGDVYVCGINERGILGLDSQETHISVPQQIPQISKVRQISAGFFYTGLII